MGWRAVSQGVQNDLLGNLLMWLSFNLTLLTPQRLGGFDPGRDGRLLHLGLANARDRLNLALVVGVRDA